MSSDYESLGGWLLIFTIGQIRSLYEVIKSFFDLLPDMISLLGLWPYLAEEGILVPTIIFLVVFAAYIVLVLCLTGLIVLTVFKKTPDGDEKIKKCLLNRYLITLVYSVALFASYHMLEISGNDSILMIIAVLNTIELFIWLKYFSVSDRVSVYFSGYRNS